MQSGSEPDGEQERINGYLIENGIIDPPVRSREFRGRDTR
ncbi:hypothetical protein SAMN05660733_05948 [Lentzea albidocapillata]|uniref:Uncharacterized protein n=1 Tax=Lentzea albidocapillata TaxID=40571 RepID=A0A1W2FFP5_9PSEU|nr:hypothetical protein SAMN05660733_05948 [Lentzea albidocapillata]